MTDMKPDGWDNLSSAQKEWCLREAGSRRRPVWAMVECVPSDESIQAQWAAEKSSDRGAIIASVVILIAMVAFLTSGWWLGLLGVVP